MAYRAPFGKWGSYFALFWCIIIAFTKNFPAFTKGSYGSFDYKNFITGYLGIPLYLIMIFGYKFIYKTKGHTPLDADIWTGKGMCKLLKLAKYFADSSKMSMIGTSRCGRIRRRERKPRVRTRADGFIDTSLVGCSRSVERRRYMRGTGKRGGGSP